MTGALTALVAPSVVALLPICRSWYKTPRDLMRGRKLSLAEKALFWAILDIWNCANEVEWFPATNATLRGFAGLNQQAFLRARRGLILKQIILTQPGMRRLATRYHLATTLTLALKRKAPPLKTSTSLVSGTEAHHKTV